MTYDEARSLMTELLARLRAENLVPENPDRLKDLTAAQIVGPRGSGILSLTTDVSGREVVYRVGWATPLPERQAAGAVPRPHHVFLEPPAERAAAAVLVDVQ
jgi:hypothetical protein